MNNFVLFACMQILEACKKNKPLVKQTMLNRNGFVSSKKQSIRSRIT